MPFFCVFNLMTSHQSRSMVWSHEKFQNEIQSKLSKDQIHNPQKIKLPPYYPDTPIVRKTVARFHDCVTAMDQEVGKFSSNCKRMDWLRILSCSSFLITDQACPGTSVPCSTAVCMFHSWSVYPKNGSILLKSNQGKQPTGW